MAGETGEKVFGSAWERYVHEARYKYTGGSLQLLQAAELARQNRLTLTPYWTPEDIRVSINPPAPLQSPGPPDGGASDDRQGALRLPAITVTSPPPAAAVTYKTKRLPAVGATTTSGGREDGESGRGATSERLSAGGRRRAIAAKWWAALRKENERRRRVSG